MMDEKLELRARAGYAAAQKHSEVKRTAPYGGDSVTASWDMLKSWEKMWFLNFVKGDDTGVWEKRSRELRVCGRVGVLMSMLALHEFGHAELVGWIAAGIAGTAVVAAIAVWLEPVMMKTLYKWHKREDMLDQKLMNNPWYRGRD